MLLTPLEQFEIIPLIQLPMLLNLDFSFTNLLLVNFIVLIFFSLVVYLSSTEAVYIKNNSLYFLPNVWQIFVETIYTVVSQLLFDNINLEGQKFFPFMSVIFIFILFNNLIGLIPYSFTVTSHLIVTFTLSFSIFFGIIFIAFKHHKMNMLSLFLPANTSFVLALVLVPIEFVSFVAKPISLGVRLFINLMAGHTLLKVIVGFSWSLLILEDLLSIVHVIPLLVLVVLMGLELGVALIQAYVFTILTCIYLNDSVNLH